ncbi:MAG: LytTR family DNA-binding domain-containing protein [Bacteroidia bacterium]|jgi:two-component system LytT family response regulator|nr:LytTR family DNA-binding domain-containing protein [Bacteroidia bacterium]
MYKAIIIDDEKMARTLLEGIITESHADLSVVETCKDLPSGVKAIRKHKPDLVFLDIEMPGHSGLELLDFFDENEVTFSIIFVTAYNQYAIHALRLSAVDYLLKPVDVKELSEAITRFKQQENNGNYQVLKHNLNTPGLSKIAIHTVGSVKFIDLNDILFFKADGAYSQITLKNHQVITTSRGLKYYEDLLNSTRQFFRCHKSYIINTAFVVEYIKSDGGSLLLEGGFNVGLSSDKAEELLNRMGK